MRTRKAFPPAIVMKSNWTYPLLILFIVEKIVQHTIVTLAFYFNWKDIVATVAVSPVTLMILGALVTVLFVISLSGMIMKRSWAIKLIVALALFDIIGEFIAQGRIDIVITLSLIIATLLLILALRYRRQLRFTLALNESPSGARS